MKRIFLSLVIFCGMVIQVKAQAVGINTDGSAPDASSILDIKSTSKGLLVPRMTTLQRMAISSPANGLMVFDTDSKSFWYYDGTSWQNHSIGWSLNGNDGIDSSRFIGTINHTPLFFRVNNELSGQVGLEDGNVALGFRTLTHNVSGAANVALGWGALYSNTTGNGNISLGQGTLQNTTTASYNVAIGYQATFLSTAGDYNTAVGYQSLYHNTGTSNTAIGSQALVSNTSGGGNTAMGGNSMHSNTTGISNTAIGYDAMFFNTTGNDNIAIGNLSLAYNTTGSENIAVGNQALKANTTGANNTAYGSFALVSNTTAINNTATGNSALFANTIGYNNTATGAQALLSNTTAINNTANGASALLANTTGSDNTAVGFGSLVSNTEGSWNTADGANALSTNTIGTFNTGIGFQAMNGIIDGIQNTSIGAFCTVSAGSISNSIGIGYNTVVDASNKVRIGNTGVTVIEGQVPFTTPSDGRFKYNVREDVKGLDFIMQLRPVTYQFDVKKFDAQVHSNQKDYKQDNMMQASWDKAAAIRRTGFIAQEVEQAALQTGYDFSGIIKPESENGHYSLSYESFVVPLVKAVQEQQKVIDSLLKRIEALEKANNK